MAVRFTLDPAAMLTKLPERRAAWLKLAESKAASAKRRALRRGERRRDIWVQQVNSPADDFRVIIEKPVVTGISMDRFCGNIKIPGDTWVESGNGLIDIAQGRGRGGSGNAGLLEGCIL